MTICFLGTSSKNESRDIPQQPLDHPSNGCCFINPTFGISFIIKQQLSEDNLTVVVDVPRLPVIYIYIDDAMFIH